MGEPGRFADRDGARDAGSRCDRADGGRRIRHVMQDPQREREIKRIVVNRDIADARRMKADVGNASQVLPRNRERVFTRVEEVKMADPRRNQHRPTAATAAYIHAYRIGRKFAPRENMKIRLEDRFAIRR